MTIRNLNLKLPRPITTLHQVEVTSRCSLSCPYCVHPKLKRHKVDMSMETFEKAMVHVDYYVNRELSQTELNLAGIGESTLHPNFLEMVKKAREVVGTSTFLTFATNGTEWTEELAKGLAPYMSQYSGVRPGIHVSLHRPEKAKKAIDLARKYGLLAGVSNDPALNTVDWAGQVPFEVTAPLNRECPWIRQGWAIAFSTGVVGTCTNDSGEASKLGTLDDPVGTWVTKPWDLCAACDQQVAIDGYTQYPEGQRRLPMAKRV